MNYQVSLFLFLFYLSIYLFFRGGGVRLLYTAYGGLDLQLLPISSIESHLSSIIVKGECLLCYFIFNFDN